MKELYWCGECHQWHVWAHYAKAEREREEKDRKLFTDHLGKKSSVFLLKRYHRYYGTWNLIGVYSSLGVARAERARHAPRTSRGLHPWCRIQEQDLITGRIPSKGSVFFLQKFNPSIGTWNLLEIYASSLLAQEHERQKEPLSPRGLRNRYRILEEPLVRL